MVLRSCTRALALLLLALLIVVEARPQAPQAPAAGKAPAGTAYDEIVVETHLAVRSKAPSVGVGLRRAKAVYFRPNATASGAEVRHITPLSAASSTVTTSRPAKSDDGIAFAARVVGVENPLVTRARLAAERSRRESSGTPGGYSSSRSYSYKSSSSSKSSFSGPAEQAKPAAAESPSSSSSTSTSSRSSSWTLPGGQTFSVHEDSLSSQVGGAKPLSSTVLRVLIGDQ